MLDRKFIRENRDKIEALVEAKNAKLDVDQLYRLDGEVLRLKQELEGMRKKRNELSAEIGKQKKIGGDASRLMAEVKAQDDREKELNEQHRKSEDEYLELASWLPNIPDDSVPVGKDESANKLIREWGKPPEFAFKPLPHYELGEALGIIDFQRATKIAGARFNVMCGKGAALERALISFMLDRAGEKGYLEIYPPFMAARESLFNCAQLPKLEDDMYRLPEDDMFLIPTAEVPLLSFRAGEEIKTKELPLLYTAYTPSFRREAGSYGKDTRGLIRQHQFDKVELFALTKPTESFEQLEKLTADAESILQALALPYQTVILSTGDMSFASTKTYDLEVWMPAQGKYREISSCSNCTDFQARRAGIRFRDENKKLSLVHTLNGSGLAVGRTWAAILENYQQQDGSVVVPEVLRGYLGGLETITAVKD